jgi:hypothetical protein
MNDVGLVLAKPKVEPAPEQTAAKPTVRERYSAARNEETIKLCGERPPGEQQSIFAEFAKQTDRALNTYIQKRHELRTVKATFADWFFMQT